MQCNGPAPCPPPPRAGKLFCAYCWWIEEKSSPPFTVRAVADHTISRRTTCHPQDGRILNLTEFQRLGADLQCRARGQTAGPFLVGAVPEARKTGVTAGARFLLYRQRWSGKLYNLLEARTC